MKEIEKKDAPEATGGLSVAEDGCFPSFPVPDDYPPIPIGPFPGPLPGTPLPGHDETI
jgi:hypothetical protein